MRWRAQTLPGLCILMLIAVASVGLSQGREAPAPAGSAAGEGAGGTTAVVTPVSPKLGLNTLVDVNVQEQDLPQVVRLLAWQSGVNVMMGKEVQGTVTCSLTRVTVKDALSAILQSNGYEIAQAGSVLVVSPLAKKGERVVQPQAKIVRKTFRLPYTGMEADFTPSTGSEGYTAPVTKGDSKSVDETIRDMLSPIGRMAFYGRQNLVIVEDVEAVVAIIDEFVKALWEVPIQVFIDSSLMEVTLTEGEDLGLRWDMLTKVGRSGKKALSPTGTDRPGTTFETSAPSRFDDTVFSYGIVNANVAAVLEALATRKRVDLQSNPRILVMNHRTATIVVGQEIPYLSSEESTGGDAIRTYEFKEVAVRLEVTPHVAESGGLIFMDVHPTVKSVIEYTEETNQPVLSTREAVTNVAIHDGSTLIIGGLVQRNIVKSWWETPFISKIPLIGLLFKQKSHSDTKNDLIFLLTPRLLTPDLMAMELASKEGITAKPPTHAGESEPGKPKW